MAALDNMNGAMTGGMNGEGAARPIRVAIVDDDPLVRTGLTMLLAAAPDIAVVGEATNGAQAQEVVDAHWPDVVLMDIRMPIVDGLVATERLRTRRNPPAVVVLTTFDADDYVVRALRAGASGFLLKDTPPRDIIAAIRTVAAGDAMLSPSVTRQVIARFADPAGAGRREQARRLLDGLTDRERAVALAVGRGRSNAEIGADLRLSVPTVKAHVSRVLTKLNVTNRVQVALLVHDADLS